MKYKSFEDFLIDRHADQYVGLDDEMPDDCDNWIGNLDSDELTQLADKFGEAQYKRGLEDAKKNILELP
jgi:uncharacterized protein (DUF2164 family)